jgi:hypothetical protein
MRGPLRSNLAAAKEPRCETDGGCSPVHAGRAIREPTGPPSAVDQVPRGHALQMGASKRNAAAATGVGQSREPSCAGTRPVLIPNKPAAGPGCRRGARCAARHVLPDVRFLPSSWSVTPAVLTAVNFRHRATYIVRGNEPTAERSYRNLTAVSCSVDLRCRFCNEAGSYPLEPLTPTPITDPTWLGSALKTG